VVAVPVVRVGSQLGGRQSEDQPAAGIDRGLRSPARVRLVHSCTEPPHLRGLGSYRPTSEAARFDVTERRSNIAAAMLRQRSGVSAVGALIAAVVAARLLGGGWAAALGLGALLALGTYLWLEDERRQASDLGQGILVSVLVALAFLAVQRDAEERIREIDAARDLAEARQSLRLTLGLQDDLSRIDLSGRDLRRFVLVRKRLTEATLDRARLDRAVLSGSDLRHASALGTSFSNAILADADLRGMRVVSSRVVVSNEGSPAQSANEVLVSRTSFQDAVLDWAVLKGVDLRRVNLAGASLRGANLAGARLSRSNMARTDLVFADLSDADLAGANLEGADLRNARVCSGNLGQARLADATFNSSTEWPPGYDPAGAGATEQGGPVKSDRGVAIPTPNLSRCGKPAPPGFHVPPPLPGD
jgi:uncharacterized protein YjbI with pentapeptide repeats